MRHGSAMDPARRHRLAIPDPRRGRFWSAVASLAVLASLAACGNKPPSLTPAQLLNAGLAAAQGGNPSQARTDYEEVIKADPHNAAGLDATAWYDLGVLDESQGNAQAARSDYQQALLLDPRYANALFNVAIMDSATAPQVAIGLFEQVLQIAPNDPKTMFNLGLLLYRTGKVAQGRLLLRKALTLNPALRSGLPKGITFSGPAPTPSASPSPSASP